MNEKNNTFQNKLLIVLNALCLIFGGLNLIKNKEIDTIIILVINIIVLTVNIIILKNKKKNSENKKKK